MTLAIVFGLPLRGAQGFVASLLILLGRDDFFHSRRMKLPVPHYSTLCRRRQSWKAVLPGRKSDKPLRLVVDSTGLKVSGEGECFHLRQMEWKVKKHGKDRKKRRVWRKVHFAVDADTHLVCAATATGHEVADGTVLPDLLERVEGTIQQVSGDGGYDWHSCYAAIRARDAKALVPPRKGAIIWRHGNCKGERLDRDEALRAIGKKGRAAWKTQSGYHIRSLAETAVSRFKGIFGSHLSARLTVSQNAETLLRCAALNRMTGLGMPRTETVQA